MEGFGVDGAPAVGGGEVEGVVVVEVAVEGGGGGLGGQELSGDGSTAGEAGLVGAPTGRGFEEGLAAGICGDEGGQGAVVGLESTGPPAWLVSWAALSGPAGQPWSSIHPAIHPDLRAVDAPAARAGEVEDGGRDVVGGAEAA